MLKRVFDNLMSFRRLVRKTDLSVSARDAEFPVYVINLTRAPERRKYITAHLFDLGMKPIILDAIDGQKLHLDELEAAGIYDDFVANRTFDRSLTLPEIGCAMSHLLAYQKLVESGAELALIVEDDSAFVDGAFDALSSLISKLPVDWGLVQLRYDCQDYVQVNEQVVKFQASRCLPVAATAYFVRRSAALALFETAYPIRYPADSLLGRSYKWDVVAYGSFPELAGVNSVFPSMIQGKLNLRFRVSNAVKYFLVWLLR